MQVQWLNFKSINSNYEVKNRNNINYNLQSVASSDAFVKNNTQVSFTGKTDKSSKKQDLIDNLTAVGVVGGAFALSVGSAIYFTKHQNPELIFLSDGTFIMDTKNQSFKSEHINADGDDGILQIKGTGINIRPERFDYVDAENGVYKNYDGSVDIDLLHSKYIDKENGILIDPDNNISAIVNNKGTLENIVVPNFGSGYPVHYWDSSQRTMNSHYMREHYKDKNLTREEFQEIYGMKPEEAHSDFYQGKILPADNRSFTEKLKDFFSGYNSNGEKTYDIFGREILTVKLNGKISHVAIDEDLAQTIEKFDLNNNSISELHDFFNKLKLSEYVKAEQPDFSLFNISENISIEKFIDNLSSEKVIEIIENIGTDSLPSDNSLFETFRDNLGL